MNIDFSVISYWRFIVLGLETTAALAAFTMVGATIIGVAVGLGRHYGPAWLRWPLTFYIDTMRAIPELAVMVWAYMAFPIMVGVTLPSFWAALAALSLQVAAYVAEVVRAGLTSIRPGQTYAALALGMSRPQLVRVILLPQAIVRMLPPYGSILSMIIKDTAIASAVAVPELMNRAQVVAAQSYRPVESLTIAMVLYIIILIPFTRGIDALYRRVAHLGRS
jgi:polar amino acid transport system permease protein